MTTKWTFTTGGDVSATPTVEDGALYVPDWGGNLFKIDAITGEPSGSKKCLTIRALRRRSHVLPQP